MKKETIAKRLAKSNANKGTSSYKLLTEWLASDFNYKIRPCWTSGRGRFTSNLDYTNSLCMLLSSLRIRYEVGNDAPRGGKTGNYVLIIL